MCDNELFEKVEKGTDICISSTGGCLKCPYVPFYPGSCSYYRSVDTLALIRSQQARIKEFEAAQEPKEVKYVRRLTRVMKGTCPACEMEIESVKTGKVTKFCKFCGQAVKWDG